jgi:hypothetical protein
MSSTKAEAGHVSVDSPLGKIKGIPVAALGWVVMALAFGFLLVKMTGSFEQSLVKISEELPKQTVILEKILDKH